MDLGEISDGWWLWGRGRRYCVEGAAGSGGGESCQQLAALELRPLALTINRRTDKKCLVVGLVSRLGSVDGSWCRDARTAERLYTGFRAGQGCHPGLRVGVRSV